MRHCLGSSELVSQDLHQLRILAASAQLVPIAETASVDLLCTLSQVEFYIYTYNHNIFVVKIFKYLLFPTAVFLIDLDIVDEIYFYFQMIIFWSPNIINLTSKTTQNHLMYIVLL